MEADNIRHLEYADLTEDELRALREVEVKVNRGREDGKIFLMALKSKR